MNYVKAINGITHDNIKSCITNIYTYLEKIRNNEINFNISKMEMIKNNIVYKSKLEENIKILKKHPLTTIGLIEGIIQLTLYYYDYNVTLLSTLHKKKSILFQIMPFSSNKTLGSLLYDIYNNSNNNNFEKNNKCLNILNAIANKLNYLQENCGFIHGDFHSGNILFNEETGDTQFIDFGYSYIHLPGTKLTIFVPIEVNIQGELLEISNNNQSKSVDLFRLIESFTEDKTHIFKDFIKQISERYFRNFDKSIYTTLPNRKKKTNGFRGLPIPFSRSSYFLDKKENNTLPSSFMYVSPIQFIQFTLDPNNVLNHPLDRIFPNYKKNNKNNTKSVKSLFNTMPDT